MYVKLFVKQELTRLQSTVKARTKNHSAICSALGPYLFGVGLITTLLSKEIWVVDHGFAEVIGFFGAVLLLTKKVGPKMAKWLDSQNDVSKPQVPLSFHDPLSARWFRLK